MSKFCQLISNTLLCNAGSKQIVPSESGISSEVLLGIHTGGSSKITAGIPLGIPLNLWSRNGQVIYDPKIESAV